MNKLSIIFMGTAELSCASLEQLARDPRFNVLAAVTQPDKPAGRELKFHPPPVKLAAQKLAIRVWQPLKARDEKFISELSALGPDLIVVAAYGHILPQTILNLPRFGCLNVHTSLLPKYRGAAPIQWAIANGETETGVTIMKMDAGMDTGPILTQARTPISPEDDSGGLHRRLGRLGADLLLDTIPGYIAGTIVPKPQGPDASYAPKIKREDGRIDWNRPARTILNRLRAFTPWPGAFTALGTAAKSLLLKIWRADVIPQSGTAGEILSADQNGIVVAAGDQALRILELQLEGGRRMNSRDFLAGHELKPGQKL